MKKRRKPSEPKQAIKKIVPDTSILIHGKLSELIKSNKLKNIEIIIPEIVMGELQAQASKGRETGFLGLDEVKTIRDLSDKYKIKLKIVGQRPSFEDIQLAKSGRLDALIQDTAKKEKAVLVTSDLPQALVAEAQGIPVKYFESFKVGKKIKLSKFFDKNTMSIHLKEGVVPFAKRGRPGQIKIVKLSKKKMKKEEIEKIIKEIMDAARYEEKGFFEFGGTGASIIQLKDMRIAITKPPFSDALELTVVKPVVKLTLDDYKLSKKLKNRLEQKAEGIILSGSPGSGKSTLAASIAEFYLKRNKIVKTLESPRDLQVPDEITQYGPLDGRFDKTADVLLLVRPDYVIFDEIRKSKEFEIFADLRLAGIGLVGVIHSSEAIDAIQRFIGKIDLGLIPSIVDTIIFLKDGAIKKVYSLKLVVKVPSGMTEADLTRPVVEVRDFENDKLEYEIYTYGEQTVVVPIVKEKKTGLKRLALSKIKDEIMKYDPNAQISFLTDDKVSIKVRNSVIPKIIGRDGKTIKKLEEKLGINIEIEPLVKALGKEIKYKIDETGSYIIFSFGKKYAKRNANIYINNEYLFSATIGLTGQIKITKHSDLGKSLLNAITNKKHISIFI
ncbi:MAG: Flp pilus assembly complex ATPase component TadA [Candidatus Aenigmarchaeota archaeon]|nr:Flp pilus assembly complex ATPase component TadA [Candidatus Aenigmarchaeota archaeon]